MCCILSLILCPIYRLFTDISTIYNRYCSIFFDFFSFDFRLLISCRKDSTPEMSTIYKRYIVTFPSLLAVTLKKIELQEIVRHHNVGTF